MKGFTKGKGKGKKFIPTSNKKTGLRKSDIKHQHEDDRIGRTLPLTRKKQSMEEIESNDHLKRLELYDGKVILLSPEGFKVARKKMNELANEFRDKAEGKSDSEKAHLYLVDFQKEANDLADEIEKEYPPTVNGRIVKEGENGLEFSDRNKETLTEAEKKKNRESFESPMTEAEQKKTLEILNMLDGMGSGLDKDGKELQQVLTHGTPEEKSQIRKKNSLDDMQKIQDAHIESEIELGLKNRTNESDIEAITERLQEYGGGVGLNESQMLHYIKKNPEANKTLLKAFPNGGFLGEPPHNRNKETLDEKGSWKVSRSGSNTTSSFDTEDEAHEYIKKVSRNGETWNWNRVPTHSG